MRLDLGAMTAPRMTFWAAVLICLPSLCGAAPAIRGDWAHGEGVVAGEGWSASFKPGVPGLVLESGPLSVAVSPSANKAPAPLGASQAGLEGDCVRMRTAFGEGDGATLDLRFTDDGLACLTPGKDMEGVELTFPIEIGVLPGRRLEDVFYFPDEFDASAEVHIPAENWFLALTSGGDAMVACAWESGAGAISLVRDAEAAVFNRLHVKPCGPMYFRMIAMPGVWHRERLQLEYLEKDVTLDWKPPVPGEYRTQFPLKGESTTRRTFVFGSRKRREWLPEVGAFTSPAWLKNGKAYLYLSKRVPPKGDAIIYPFSKAETSLMTFMERTPVAAVVTGRCKAPSTGGRPPSAPNVGFNACWGTYLLRRTVYVTGANYREREFLDEHNAFLADCVAGVQHTNAIFGSFLKGLHDQIAQWRSQESLPAAQAFLDAMLEEAEMTQEAHAWEMDVYEGKTPEDHVARANRHLERLRELCETPGTEHFPECYRLIDELNRLSAGHIEQTGMRFSMLTRAWAQEAALSCTGTPEAAPYARDIRAAIRQALSGPGGR